MSKRLISRSLPPAPAFDPGKEFPKDVERLIVVATNGGYAVSPQDAAELLRRHAEVRADEMDRPEPPDGYATWLDYAVETMDARSQEIEGLFFDKQA